MMMDGDLRPVRAPAPQAMGRGAPGERSGGKPGGADAKAGGGGRQGGGVKPLQGVGGRAGEYTEAQRKRDRHEEFKIKGRPFVEIEIEFGLSRRLM